MNLTITVDDEVLARARRVALEQGRSVQELIRDYLASLSADERQRREAAAERLEALFRGHGATAPRAKRNREEIYEERLIRRGPAK